MERLLRDSGQEVSLAAASDDLAGRVRAVLLPDAEVGCQHGHVQPPVRAGGGELAD